MSYSEKNKRLVYIDLIKIIAIIGVIFIHVSADYWYKTPIDSNRWEAMNLWNAIGRCGVDIFVMCSGVLFLSKKELSYKDLFKKYIPRLIIAFVVWTFIYSLIKADFNIRQSFLSLKQGLPRAHLWFLIMIMGLYLVVPITRIFIKNAGKKDIEYFLLLFFTIQSVLPFLQEFELFNWMKNYFKHIHPAMITGYIGYFVSGYYLNKYKLDNRIKVILVILGIISIIATVLLNLNETRELSKPSTTFFNNFYINIALYSTAVFIIVKEFCDKIKFNETSKKIISKLGSLVFGVYLIHIILEDILNSFNINALMCNTYLAIPITSTIIFITSLAITYIISKIPYLRRIVL